MYVVHIMQLFKLQRVTVALCVPISYIFSAWDKTFVFRSHLIYGKLYVTKRSVTFSFVFHFRLMLPREGGILFSLIGENSFQVFFWEKLSLRIFFHRKHFGFFFQSISDQFLNDLSRCILYFFSSSNWRSFFFGFAFTFFS